MLVTLDTSCVINLLTTAESPNSAVVELLRAALDGRIQLRVTEVVSEEIPKTATNAYLRARVAGLPVLEVAGARREELDGLASRIFAEMWPNAMPGSSSSDHGARDARHLAAHLLCGAAVFVSLDKTAVKKCKTARSLSSTLALTPEEAVQHLLAVVAPARPRTELEDVIVRRAVQSDAAAIAELMTPIRDLYPNFDRWRASALDSKQAFVGCVDGRVAAIAVWDTKAPRVVKLSTFFVREEDRGQAIGPHLLFHQLRLWASEEVTKVFVTVSDRVRHVVDFFLEFGFRIEGASPRRYGNDGVEIVLGKHFVYGCDEGADALRDRYRRLLVETPELFELNAEAWFMAPAPAETRRAQFDRLSTRELEEILFPVRLPTPGRKAFLIPIQPQWADRMVQYRKVQPELAFGAEKLLLRTDNAYYCHPRYESQDLEGEHALFYVSGKAGVIAGAARILERHIETPEDLYLRFGDLGVYDIDQVRERAKAKGARSGEAMAMRFGWWLPFEQPVTLDRMRKLGMAHPQTITAIEFDQFLQVCNEGRGPVPR